MSQELSTQKVEAKGRVRPGRKPKPEGRRNAVPANAGHVQVRVTREVREALEAEAERTGRPLSRVAEKWLESGRVQGDKAGVVIADPGVAPVLIAVNLAWEAVVARLGPPGDSDKSWHAMISACNDVILEMVPRPTISPGERMMVAAEHAACFLLEQLCREAGLPYPFDPLKWPGDFAATKYILETVLSELSKAGIYYSSKSFPSPTILIEKVRLAPGPLSPVLSKTLAFLEVFVSMSQMRSALDRDALEAAEEGAFIVGDIFPGWRRKRRRVTDQDTPL